MKGINGHVTGAGWRERDLNIEYLAASGEKKLHTFGIGDEVALRIDGGRDCIGSRPPGAESLTACPDAATGLSSSQCTRCFERALLLPCLRCTGEICRNPVRRGQCVQPDNHALYLANFGPGHPKVGVARWDRRAERLYEQGARAAIVIARDDGQKIRRAESQIRRFGIPDRLQMREKLGLLTVSATVAELEEELLDAFGGIRLRMRASWLKEPEVVAMPEQPLVEVAPRLIGPRPSLCLRGTIEAIDGQAVIMRNDSGELVALEVSALAGYRVSPLAEGHGSSGQMALTAA